MGGLWFSSDFHFSHRLVAEHRGYGDDLAAHDQAIISNWNSLVAHDDDAWILGDISLKKPADFWPLVDQLNGTKHLISGNHDQVWPGHRKAEKAQREWLEHFASVQPFARRSISSQAVMLSHFPWAGAGDHTEKERYTQYRLVNRGGWLLCGHVHWNWKQRGRMINVGLDAWQMAPARLDHVEALIKAGAADLECPPAPAQAANDLAALSEELGL